MEPVVLHQAGPLPIKTTVKWPSTDVVTMAVSGSAWTQSPNTTVAVNVSVGDQMIGTLQIFANQAQVHLALPDAFIATQGAFGEFPLTLTAANGNTITDANDIFTVALLY
jgi:hypothetical protein